MWEKNYWLIMLLINKLKLRLESPPVARMHLQRIQYEDWPESDSELLLSYERRIINPIGGVVSKSGQNQRTDIGEHFYLKAEVFVNRQKLELAYYSFSQPNQDESEKSSIIHRKFDLEFHPWSESQSGQKLDREATLLLHTLLLERPVSTDQLPFHWLFSSPLNFIQRFQVEQVGAPESLEIASTIAFIPESANQSLTDIEFY